jgi:hypothetical protein
LGVDGKVLFKIKYNNIIKKFTFSNIQKTKKVSETLEVDIMKDYFGPAYYMSGYGGFSWLGCCGACGGWGWL